MHDGGLPSCRCSAPERRLSLSAHLSVTPASPWLFCTRREPGHLTNAQGFTHQAAPSLLGTLVLLHTLLLFLRSQTEAEERRGRRNNSIAPQRSFNQATESTFVSWSEALVHLLVHSVQLATFTLAVGEKDARERLAGGFGSVGAPLRVGTIFRARTPSRHAFKSSL